MTWETLKSGAVIRYPYLWARQSAAGELEGRKARPAAVGVRVPRTGGDLLVIFAITTSQPQTDRWAVEVPDAEKVRAGLDRNLRQWIILDEANVDQIGHSFYLSPDLPLGKFSQSFFAPIILQIVARYDQISKVPRG